MKRFAIFLIFIVSILASSKAHGQSRDVYGGMMSQSCTNATGHITTVKIGNKWRLCTPAGHTFFFQGIGCWTYPGNGGCSAPALGTKFSSANQAALQIQNEFLYWNFNAVGEKTFGGLDLVTLCPGCKILPEMQSHELLGRALYQNTDCGNITYNSVKDMAFGVNINGSPWYFKTLTDIFDNNLITYFNACFSAANFQAYAVSPYYLGPEIDDSDFLLGVGGGPDFDAGGSSYGGGKNDNDLARIVLTTSPVQTYNPTPTRCVLDFGNCGSTPSIEANPGLYSDSKVYTKAAMASPPANCLYATPCSWREYAAKKYGTIATANAAWGTNRQGWYKNCTTRTSNVISLGCAITLVNSGDTVIVGGGIWHSGGVTGNCSLSDTAGSVWVLVQSTTIGSSKACVFVGTVNTTVSDTVTLTTSDSETGADIDIQVNDIAGITSVVDASGTNTGTGTSITASLTTTQSSDYLFAFIYNQSAAHDVVSLTNGFALRSSTDNDDAKETRGADLYPSSGAGVYSTTFSGLTAGTGLHEIIIALKNGSPVGGYTTFDSSGTPRTQTICTGTTWTGSNSTCSDTLSNLKVSPYSVSVTVDSVLQAGDCPWFAGTGTTFSLQQCGAIATNTGYLGGSATGLIATTSSINYQTGAVTINFKNPPSAGTHTIIVSWVQNGWTFGTGLMDEDGRNPWAGTNPVCLLPVNGGGPGTDSWACRPGNPGGWAAPNMNSALATDLEDWEGQFSARFHGGIKASLNANAPGILFLGEDILGAWEAPPNKNILKGANGNLDIMFTAAGWSPDEAVGFSARSQSDYNKVVDYMTTYFGDHPMINFQVYNAQPDSALGGVPDSPLSFSSQAHRGQGYYNLKNAMLKTPSNGSYPWVGDVWWGSHDFGPGGENTDFGLKDNTDNAYDGNEPAVATVPCSFPLQSFNCGSEPAPLGTGVRPFGNAISGDRSVTTANALWFETATLTISSCSQSATGNITTCTTDINHGLRNSQVVTITGESNSAFNQSNIRVWTVPSSTTFTFYNSAPAPNASGTGGSLTPITDQYGGLLSSDCINPNAPTGWSTVKLGSRWWYCTPDSHPYFWESVGGIANSGSGTDSATGLTYDLTTTLKNKYGLDSFSSLAGWTFGLETNRRATFWNFNGVGQLDQTEWIKPWEKCSVNASGADIAACQAIWKQDDQPIKMPFVDTINTSQYAGVNLNGYGTGPLKNLMRGTNWNHFTWFRIPNLDFFDPNHQSFINGFLTNDPSIQTITGSSHTIGLFIDDTDWFNCMAAGADFDTVPPGHNAAHCGRQVLITSPVQAFMTIPAYQGDVTRDNQIYTDTKVYSKTAMASPPTTCTIATPCSLRDFLSKKYALVQSCASGQTGITGLNNCWGSTYTTFDSSGTVRTAEVIGTGNGSTKQFSVTLANPTPAAFSIQVKVNGVPVGGDCPNWLSECNITTSGIGSMASPSAAFPPQATVFTGGGWVQDSNGYLQKITTSGVTAASAPTWNTTLGGTTTSNTAVFTNQGPAIVFPPAPFLRDVCFGAITCNPNGNFPAASYQFQITYHYSSPQDLSPSRVVGTTDTAGGHQEGISGLTDGGNPCTGACTGYDVYAACRLFSSNTPVFGCAAANASFPALTLQASNIAPGTSWIIPNTGVISGSALPSPPSFVNYSTGAITVKFAVAPPSGASITVDYVQNGWGVGTGVMDEDGRGSWTGTNEVCLSTVDSSGPGKNSYACRTGAGLTNLPDANQNLATDLDAWQSQFAGAYFHPISTAVATKNVLYLGPDTIGAWGVPPRKQILVAAGAEAGMPVIFTNFNPAGGAPAVAAFNYYGTNYGDKPMMNFVTSHATADSDLFYYDEAAQTVPYGMQTDRGQGWYDTLNFMLNTANTSGTFPWIGINWWGMYDFFPSERTNWGLISLKDNPYNGTADCIATSTDPWGFTVGGEPSQTGAGVIPLWQATTVYQFNTTRSRIQKTITGTTYIFEPTNNGSDGPGTSGSTEPTWPTTLNSTVVDGTVTWTNVGSRNTAVCFGNTTTKTAQGNALWLNIINQILSPFSSFSGVTLSGGSIK